MNILKYIQTGLLIGLCVAVCSRYSYAQSADSLSLLKKFIRVSSNYQQIPLFLEVEISNSSNAIWSEEDTTTAIARFYLTKGASYVRYGDVEQMTNDSMALVISNKLKRMMLFPEAQAALAVMRSLHGIVVADSSVAKLAGEFQVMETEPADGQPGIVLNSRSSLSGTKVPRKSIRLQYTKEGEQPTKVITTQRSLQPISKADYAVYQEKEAMRAMLIHEREDEYFLVVEKNSVVSYRTISHDMALKVPATIGDRIGKNEQGLFRPTRAYENYVLTVNQ